MDAVLSKSIRLHFRGAQAETGERTRWTHHEVRSGPERNHVVQKVFEKVRDVESISFIPEAFVGQVPSLASHCYSCRVLQRGL